MHASAPLSPDVLGSPEGIVNPYPVYRAFRGSNPVRLMRLPAGATPGQTAPLYSWALLSHKSVVAALRDPATFSAYSPQVLKNMPKLPMVHDDPPQHTRLRRLVNKAFSPQRVASLAEPVGRIAQDLLNASGQGPVEFMAAYAVPLPIQVIAQLLGLPPQDYPSLKLWSDAMISYVGIPPEERARKLQALSEYLRQTIAERRAQPREDLISALVEAKVEGESLSDEGILNFTTVLLIAGNETTTNLLGNMMALLADRPELWRRAREDRSLVDPIIEEVLRYESPIQRRPRVTARPVRIGEVELQAGELVDLYFGAANRDPDVFAEPEEFRPGRPENTEHVAFGFGPHFCLGAMLARLEVRISLNALLDRFPVLERGQEPAVRQNSAPLSLGYRSLPLVLG